MLNRGDRLSALLPLPNPPKKRMVRIVAFQPSGFVLVAEQPGDRQPRLLERRGRGSNATTEILSQPTWPHQGITVLRTSGLAR